MTSLWDTTVGATVTVKGLRHQMYRLWFDTYKYEVGIKRNPFLCARHERPAEL